MKLLFDQNLSRRLLPDVEGVFPGSSHVQLLGIESVNDIALWQFAAAHGFTIVSKDVDFVELQLVRGYPPKLVWLNCGNASNTELRAKLAGQLETIALMLADDDVGVVEIE